MLRHRIELRDESMRKKRDPLRDESGIIQRANVRLLFAITAFLA